GALPPQPWHLGWTRPRRDAADLHADQGAADDRSGSLGPAGRVQLLLGMQPSHAATVTVPNWPSSLTCAAVGAGQLVGSSVSSLAPWRRAGRLVGAGCWWRVGGEAAASAQPHQDRRAGAGQPLAELNG